MTKIKWENQTPLLIRIIAKIITGKDPEIVARAVLVMLGIVLIVATGGIMLKSCL